MNAAPEHRGAGGHDPDDRDAVEVTVALPVQLRVLAEVEGEVVVRVPPEPVVADVLEAFEALHPPLRGTIRDPRTGARRAYVRYFSCGRDISHEPPDTPVAPEVLAGREVFRVLGAISGG
ncbi:MAG: hypothetical protein RQ745_01990 [Longimicrobiales bacterium]|nr:hypothetical protein [Longimicrobiales bacterium]